MNPLHLTPRINLVGLAVEGGYRAVSLKMAKTEGRTGPQSNEEEIRQRLEELLEPQIVDILTNQMRIKSIKTVPLGLVKDVSTLARLVSANGEPVIVIPNSSPMASSLAGQNYVVLLSTKLRDKIVFAIK
jgi:hypothetical protein